MTEGEARSGLILHLHRASASVRRCATSRAASCGAATRRRASPGRERGRTPWSAAWTVAQPHLRSWSSSTPIPAGAASQPLPLPPGPWDITVEPARERLIASNSRVSLDEARSSLSLKARRSVAVKWRSANPVPEAATLGYAISSNALPRAPGAGGGRRPRRRRRGAPRHRSPLDACRIGPALLVLGRHRAGADRGQEEEPCSSCSATATARPRSACAATSRSCSTRTAACSAIVPGPDPGQRLRRRACSRAIPACARTVPHHPPA